MHDQAVPPDAVDNTDITFFDIKNAPEACSFASAIIHYLKEVPEYERLSILRKQGWENPAGDRFFEKQRKTADNADAATTRHFYNMMRKIAMEMNHSTGVLELETSTPNCPQILDMCMAPGGFLATALDLNPNAQAVAFTLPPSNGGHTVFLPEQSNLALNLVDITMLAADIGITSIPQTHPDSTNFLPQHLGPEQKFDLALCDGQVLRPNVHTRPEYRERGEATRLTLTQLILALKHLKPGGTMFVLLHRLEAPDTVQLLYAFDKFATVRLFKPAFFHAKRSSFYMVATDVRAQSHEACLATERWKRVWKLATFELEMGDEEYLAAVNEGCPGVEEILQDFGPKLVCLGRRVWDSQANALAKAPWMKKLKNGDGNWRTSSY